MITDHRAVTPLTASTELSTSGARNALLCSARLSAAVRTVAGPRVWTSRSWHEAVAAGSRYRYIPDHVQCSVLCTVYYVLSSAESDINQRFQPIMPAPAAGLVGAVFVSYGHDQIQILNSSLVKYV